MYFFFYQETPTGAWIVEWQNFGQCAKFLWSLANRDQNGVVHLAHPRCKIANIIGSEGQGCEKKDKLLCSRRNLALTAEVN